MKKNRIFLNETLVTQKTDPVDLKLKEGEKPICSRPYTVPKVYVFLKGLNA